MSSLRNGVKHVVENLVAISGAAAISRRTHSQQLLVLAYHNIVPTGLEPAGDLSLHMRQDAFADQLDSLVESHDVVALRDVLNGRDADRHRERPRAIITFDDAYAGSVIAGISELRSRKLSATIFATPSFLDGGMFWWDALADRANGLDPVLRERMLTEARGLTPDALALAQRSGIRVNEMPPYARGASLADINAALTYDGLSLGAHTWNHPNLTTLSDSELADEFTRPLGWLQQFGDRALPIVSYPYGLADRRVMDAARAAGYTAAFMIDGGWTSPDTVDKFAIPRLNVPAGVSRNGFVLRAAGLLSD